MMDVRHHALKVQNSWRRICQTRMLLANFGHLEIVFISH